jgi:hypothetical protein
MAAARRDVGASGRPTTQKKPAWPGRRATVARATLRLGDGQEKGSCTGNPCTADQDWLTKH